MDFIEVKIYTSTQGLENVTGALLQLGITGFVIEDAQAFEDFLTDTRIYWDYIDDEVMKLKTCESSITVYLPNNEQGAEQLSGVRSALIALQQQDTEKQWGRLEAVLANVREEDWANNWKQYFKPLDVGNRFIIKPTWEQVDDTRDRMILEIDPSTSFGTGSHHTTQLCIEQLETAVHSGDKVLDMGCGSGILAIAAVMLGAGSLTAVDIDQNSVRIANENAALNNIGEDKFKAICGNVLTDTVLAQSLMDASYDVVVANIVADVIIAMSDIFPRCLKQGGTLICSGIISERAGEVAEALAAAGFKVASTNEKADWVAISAVNGGSAV